MFASRVGDPPSPGRWEAPYRWIVVVVVVPGCVSVSECVSCLPIRLQDYGHLVPGSGSQTVATIRADPQQKSA